LRSVASTSEADAAHFRQLAETLGPRDGPEVTAHQIERQRVFFAVLIPLKRPKHPRRFYAKLLAYLEPMVAVQKLACIFVHLDRDQDAAFLDAGLQCLVLAF